MNYFVEGLQGSGKTTFAQRLLEQLPDGQVFREGDFSPVELAWCAYTTEDQYDRLLAEYPALRAEIRGKTVAEGECRVTCYTKIATDIPGFYQNWEQFEIYNGRLDRAVFENVVFGRFRRWNGKRQIFECSIFQNIVENQILYLMMRDEEILDFYRRLKGVLAGRDYRIVYLDMEDIAGGIDVVRKERLDERGNEAWFSLMCSYLEESPYGKEHALEGLDGLLVHLEHRRALEHRIMKEVFEENSVMLKAKRYTAQDIGKIL